MEERNKKTFSTILLVVGVLFIVVAGGIFVSKTWQYLSDAAKSFFLMVLTAGFFGGSVVAERRSLDKTAVALYYLGICFTGFTAGAIINLTQIGIEWGRILAMAAMSIPVSIRFFRRRSIVDAILQLFLCDGMILSVSGLNAVENRGQMTVICLATFTMALSALTYFLQEEKGLKILAIIAYACHAAIVFPATLILLVSEKNFFFLVFPVLLLAASVTVMYLVFDKNTGLRIAQSASLLYAGLTFSLFVFKNATEEFGYRNFTTAVFAAFVIGLILMVALDRKELTLSHCFLAGILSVYQVAEYLFLGSKAQTEILCHPYGLAMAIAFVAWKCFQREYDEWGKIAKYASVFGIMNLNVILSYVFEEYCGNHGVSIAIGLTFLAMAVWMKNEYDLTILSKVFQTIALPFAVFPLAFHPLVAMIKHDEMMNVIYDFRLEYACFFMGLGIVLLGIIWYDRFKGISIVQFVGACLLMTGLLLNNLLIPALPNVMILSISALVMLVVATILKKKTYAILAAVTLSLVALYLTREFWMSIAWWVYLFVAGVGLVIFAIKKEKAEK